MRRTTLAACLGLLLVVVVAPAQRASATEPYIRDLGWGAAAIGTNFFYIPAKTLYAIGGGIVGTLGYGLTLGNLEAAHNIWGPTLGGTWVLSPEMMSGRRPILFSGESYEPRRDRMRGDDDR